MYVMNRRQFQAAIKMHNEATRNLRYLSYRSALVDMRSGIMIRTDTSKLFFDEDIKSNIDFTVRLDDYNASNPLVKEEKDEDNNLYIHMKEIRVIEDLDILKSLTHPIEFLSMRLYSNIYDDIVEFIDEHLNGILHLHIYVDDSISEPMIFRHPTDMTHVSFENCPNESVIINNAYTGNLEYLYVIKRHYDDILHVKEERCNKIAYRKLLFLKMPYEICRKFSIYHSSSLIHLDASIDCTNKDIDKEILIRKKLSESYRNVCSISRDIMKMCSRGIEYINVGPLSITNANSLKGYKDLVFIKYSIPKLGKTFKLYDNLRQLRYLDIEILSEDPDELSLDIKVDECGWKGLMCDIEHLGLTAPFYDVDLFRDIPLSKFERIKSLVANKPSYGDERISKCRYVLSHIDDIDETANKDSIRCIYGLQLKHIMDDKLLNNPIAHSYIEENLPLLRKRISDKYEQYMNYRLSLQDSNYKYIDRNIYIYNWASEDDKTFNLFSSEFTYRYAKLMRSKLYIDSNTHHIH